MRQGRLTRMLKRAINVFGDSRQLRSYDAADNGRQTDDWYSPSTGPNTELFSALVTVRDRARELERNNPIVSRIIRSMTTDIVGTGIVPRPVTKNKKLWQLLVTKWARWITQSAVSSELTYYGQQYQEVRAWLGSGECYARMRPRYIDDISAGGVLAVPFQIELLEADQLDHFKEGKDPLIVQGVEFDPLGRRRAYWMHPQHPGETAASVFSGRQWGQSFAVPATEITHLYEPSRPEAVHGLPWITAIMRLVRDLDAYRAAEGERKLSEACVVGVISTDDESERTVTGIELTDSKGNDVEEQKPGSWYLASGAKQVTFNNPGQGGNYSEFMKTGLKQVAAGTSTTYERISRDNRDVSYASARIGDVDYRRMIIGLVRHFVVPLSCDPKWRYFVKMGKAAGIFPQAPDEEFEAQWVPQAFEEADRKTAAEADMLELRNGTTSLSRLVTSKEGRVLDELMPEVRQDNELMDALGIILDSDPRKTNKSGQLQGMAQQGKAVAAPVATT